MCENKNDWQISFDEFVRLMKIKLQANMAEKGTTWETCDLGYLLEKNREHQALGHNVDVANFQFMLWDRKRTKPSNSDLPPIWRSFDATEKSI
jgi:hypothetical protein